MSQWKDKVKNRQAAVDVLRPGCMGLPLVREFE